MAYGTLTYVSMFGMPVENQAVARSPQAIAIAAAEPPSKSTRRQLWASGTSSIIPFRRIRPPRCPSRMDSAIVRAVPGLMGPRASNASTRWVASGSASLSTAAMQSVGITSNPTPGQTTIPAALASAWRRCGEKNFYFAGDIEIMGPVL